jgi:7,8-dihydropterin-6-yl-methyl-4-(beta-D-ribofuranosyl)aminobenzene 5'-phosphate synthase
MIRFAFAIAIACGLIMAPVQAGAQQPARVTILYDAFGPPSALQKDWGFAALIEYGGRRILFDTGNDAGIFARNVEQLGVDLTRLDAAVISHRHGDHTTGLEVLIAANPTVPIYTPQEGAFFRGGAPRDFFVRDPSVPANMRYFDGKDPGAVRSGTPWPRGNFQIVTRTTEIFPGFFVLTTRSEKPGTREMNELSLAVRTPQGLAVVVGCSHPGVEKILEAAMQIDNHSTRPSADSISYRRRARRSSALQACCTTRSSCSASRLATAPASRASRRSYASLAIDSIRLVLA